jgi:hypothetical protein
MSCSFCGIRGHNINRCNSPTIDSLFERIKIMWIDILNTIDSVGEREIRFKTDLDICFNLPELRAVGVKYAYGLASWRKSVIIENLYNYFSSRITLPEEEQPWLEARRLPVVPDPIPDFARDLEQQQDNITWNIDRTPSYSNVASTFEEEIIPDGYRTPPSIISIHEEPPAPRRRIDFGNYIRLLSNQHDQVSLHELRDALIADFEWSNTTGDRYNIFVTRRLLRIVNESLATGRQIIVPPMPLNLDERFSPMPLNLDEARVRKFNIIPTLLVQETENLEESDDCPICYETVKILDSVKMGCGHKFCGECITQTLQKHNKRNEPCCAMCRGKMETCVVKKQEIYDKIVEYCNM